MSSYKRYTLAEFKEIADKLKRDRIAIMQETGLSMSKVYDNLKKLRDSEAAATELACPATDQEPVKTDSTEFDLAKLIPVKNYQYDIRPYDNSLEFWAWKMNKPVCLVGEAGSGKTFSCKEFARKHEVPFLLVPCEDQGSSLREQLGFWQVTSGTMIWREGILAQVLKRPCVVLFDEVNALPAGKLFMLHELTENRRLFLKDAPANKALIQVHPEARMILAMNPAGNKYSGTNKLNIALGNRLAVIEVPDWKSEELKITCTYSKEIKKFYEEATKAIKEQDLRVAISRRNLDRMSSAINNGASLKTAVMEGFINSALITASSEERQGLWNLAIAVFGIDKLEPESTEIRAKEKASLPNKKTCSTCKYRAAGDCYQAVGNCVSLDKWEPIA